MKIDIANVINQVPFSSIAKGECFSVAGELFIRPLIDVYDSTGCYRYNSLRLSNGELDNFSPGALVKPEYDVKIVKDINPM